MQYPGIRCVLVHVPCRASAGEPEYVPMGAAEARMQEGLTYSMRQLSAPLTPLPPALARWRPAYAVNC